MGTGFYLFCFASPDLAAAPEGPAVDGRTPIEVRRFAAVSAVISELPLAEFCGPDAASRLQDLAWLAPRACRHERVNEEVMRQSPVLPARFGTIFSTTARLQQFVERHAEAISEFLQRVAGQEEWAVKGLLDPARAEEAAPNGDFERLSPGRRHLEAQRARKNAAMELHRRVQQAGREVTSNLRRLATAVMERRVVAAAPEVVFNWAFLVPGEERARFRAELEQINGVYANQGLEFTCSGPWPPYSFVPALSMEDGQ